MQNKCTALTLILTVFLSIQLIMTLMVSSRTCIPTGCTTEAVNRALNMLMEADYDQKTIYVPLNFSKIQEAINAASPGDTIYVYSGTYYENIIVNKNNLTIIGEDKRSTIIDGGATGTTVYIVEQNVTISGFTVRNSGAAYGDSGVFLYSSDCSLKNNIIMNCNIGIQLGSAHRNTITDNHVQNNTYAIYMRLSSNNTFIGNIVENNACGICLHDASDNNRFCHNGFINNTKQVEMQGFVSKNMWNTTWPSGGNYWSDYTGSDLYSGPYQNITGSDGIGDTPYNVTDDERDYYPRLLTVRNVDTGLHYFSIQKAIDAAETKDNHTIRVGTAIYYENVWIYKSLTLQGENKTTTIINGDGSCATLLVTAANVKVSDFTIQNGLYGVHLNKSGGTVLRNVAITNNTYPFLVTGTELSHFINDVDESNLVENKPIYYLVNKQDLVIDGTTLTDPGYLGLVNCTNVTVQNLNLTGNSQGLLLAFTSDSTIKQINASGNLYGIYSFNSRECNFTNNNLTGSSYGIWLYASSNNTITNNNLANNSCGISLDYSSVNNIYNNDLTRNYLGIGLFNSHENNLFNNNFISIREITTYGVYIFQSNSSNITMNIVQNCTYGIWLTGCFYSSVSLNMVAENEEFGILLDNLSTNNSVIGNEVANNKGKGIYLRYSTTNTITDNNVTKNRDGIYLVNSNMNQILRNKILESDNGIYLLTSSENNIINNIVENNTRAVFIKSSNNTFYHNSFINNKYRPTVWAGYKNTWDNGWPSGGNYWSDHIALDEKRGPKQDTIGSDGIADANYTITKDNVDCYPLTKPYGGEHDIGIVDISLSKNSFTEGYSLNMTVKVINYGIYSETGINITIQTRNNTHIIPIASETFNLTYRNSKIFTCTWDTASQKNGTYTIEANITHVHGETFLSDNQNQTKYTISILGDVNGDLKDDIKDLVLVIKYYGNHTLTTVWRRELLCRNADVNNDDKVDVKDLILVVKNSGNYATDC